MDIDILSVRLKKANQFFEEAGDLLASSIVALSAANRLYYALFSAVSAVLYAHNCHLKTHKELIGQFSKLIYEKIIPFSEQDAALLVKLETYRTDADYNDFFTIHHDQVEIDLKPVGQLIYRITQYLQTTNGPFETHFPRT